jgi:hypothetical protein
MNVFDIIYRIREIVNHGRVPSEETICRRQSEGMFQIS